MTITQIEEILESINLCEDDIILYGYGNFNGETFKKEDKDKLIELKKKYEALYNKKLNQGITVRDCNIMISKCCEAERAVLAGQEYELEGKRLTRASLSEIRKTKNEYLQKKIDLERGINGGIQMFRVIAKNG